MRYLDQEGIEVRLLLSCSICYPSNDNLSDHMNSQRGKLASQAGLMVQSLPLTPCYRIVIEVFIVVAALAILRSKTNAFPVSTVIIEQYRPSVGNFVIGTVQRIISVTFPKY